MEQQASGPHQRLYKRLLVQPGIWAILLLPVLLISAVGQEIAFFHYTAERFLLDTRYQARMLALCAQQSTELQGDNVFVSCLDTYQINPPGDIAFVDASRQQTLFVSSDNIANGNPETLLSELQSGRSDRYYLKRVRGSATNLIAVANLPGSELWLVAAQPFRDVLSATDDILHVGAITGPLALVLILVVLYLTMRTIVYPLRRVASQASRIGQGDLSGLIKDDAGVDEIVQLNHSLVTMGQKISRYQYSMARYVTKITEVQEAERRRLSHDLHDETMQGLVAVGQRLQLAQRALDRDDKPGLVTRIGQARELNQMVMDELRRTIRALRPIHLEGAGLLAALEALTGECDSLGITAKFNVIGEARPIHSEVELAAFRVAQEALANVKKHAQAHTVLVDVRYNAGHFILEVTDDGTGFTPPPSDVSLAIDGHYGLVGMQERVFAVGGELEIEAAQGRGTQIRARFPYEVPATPQIIDSST